MDIFPKKNIYFTYGLKFLLRLVDEKMWFRWKTALDVSARIWTEISHQ